MKGLTEHVEPDQSDPGMFHPECLRGGAGQIDGALLHIGTAVIDRHLDGLPFFRLVTITWLPKGNER